MDYNARIGKKDKGPFKYHNVYAGRKRGIFTTWGQCKQSIHKYSKCAFKGFNDIHVAIRHMELNGIKNPILYGDCPPGVDCMKINDDTYVLCTQSIDLTETSDDAHRVLLSQKSDNNDFADLSTVMKSWSDTDSHNRSTNSMGKCTINYEENEETIPKTVFDASISSDLDLDDLSFENEITLTLAQPDVNEEDDKVSVNSVQSKSTIGSSNISTENVIKVEYIPEAKVNNINCSCSCKEDLQELKSILLDIQKEQKAAFRETEQKIIDLQIENTQIKKCFQTLKEHNERRNTIELMEKQNMMIQDILLENERKTLATIKSISDQSQQMNETLLEKMDTLHSTCNSKPISTLPSNLSTMKSAYNISSRNVGNDTASSGSDITHKIDIAVQDTHQSIVELNSGETIDQSQATYAKILSSSSLSLRPKTTYSESSLSSSDIDNDVRNFVNSEFYNSRNKKILNNKEGKSLDENYDQKNSIKLHPKCKNLLIGDSNMKNVNRRRLDNTGRTEVRTYRGATIKTVTNIIDKSTINYPQVEKITFCVGTNDCSRGFIDETKIMDDFEQLLIKTRNVFPTAEICILAIPPMANTKVNQALMIINKHLMNLMIRKNAIFMACKSLWYHVGKEGNVDPGVLDDSVHLSSWGLGLLLQSVTPFFYHQQSGSLQNVNYENNPQVTQPPRKTSPFHENQCGNQEQFVEKVANEFASSLYKVIEYLKY